MITSTEILEKLKNGESIDDIADGITKVLNIAQQDYAKFQEEERIQAKENEKRVKLTEVLTALIDWGKIYYPNIFCKEMPMNEIVDTVLESLELVGEYAGFFTGPLFDAITVDLDKPKKNQKEVNDWDTLLKNFLGAD